MKLASYQVSAEGLTSFLKLGSAEFVLSQRVDGTGGRQYLFRAKLRMKEKRQSIMVRLCRKHILYFDSLNCKGVRLKSRRTGSFEPYEVAINAGNLGPKAFVRWPMTLTIGAHGETVDITEVELLDELGRNLVNNGSFTQGTDFWFMTSDYFAPPVACQKQLSVRSYRAGSAWWFPVCYPHGNGVNPSRPIVERRERRPSSTRHIFIRVCLGRASRKSSRHATGRDDVLPCVSSFI